VLYASSTQVNAIVPFSMDGHTTANVQVNYNSLRSDAYVIPIVAAAPALFTYGSSPIVVNPDGSLNSASQAAPAGSFVTLYVTGLGQTSPAGVDGRLNQPPSPAPLAAVSIQSLTGEPDFSLLYAGGAPGLVQGVGQINIQLPEIPFAGTLKLTVGSASVIFPLTTR
jgi:uncharacterized protein (TIGR03437 family)